VRGECLDQHWFESLGEAIVQLEEWRKEYNQERPHSSVNKPYATRISGHLVTKSGAGKSRSLTIRLEHFDEADHAKLRRFYPTNGPVSGATVKTHGFNAIRLQEERSQI
jgi:hypothetical protein